MEELTLRGGGTGLPKPWSEHIELNDSLLRPLLNLDELMPDGAGGGGFLGLWSVELFTLSAPNEQIEHSKFQKWKGLRKILRLPEPGSSS